METERGQNNPPISKELEEHKEAEGALKSTHTVQVPAESLLEMHPHALSEYFAYLDSEGGLEPYLQSVLENPSTSAMISYWEKWLKKEHRVLVDRIVANKKELYPGEKSPDVLPIGLQERFSEADLRLIFENMGAVQLTYGCSKGCPFCGMDAVAGTREHTSYSELANMFQKYGPQLNHSQPFLYWASEPFDYKSNDGLEDRTYPDVHQLAEEYAGYSPYVATKELKSGEWLDFLKKNKGHSRLSVFGLSNKQISELRAIGGKKFTFLGDEVIRNHMKGMGITASAAPENAEPVPVSGIGCFNGAILTPRGLYNVFQVPISPENPQGQIVEPIADVSNESFSIEKGTRIQDVMRHSVLDLNRIGLKIIMPYVTVIRNGVYFDFTCDDEYKVKEIRETPAEFVEAARQMRVVGDIITKIFDSYTDDPDNYVEPQIAVSDLTEEERGLYPQLFPEITMGDDLSGYDCQKMKMLLTERLKLIIGDQASILGPNILDHYDTTLGMFDSTQNNLEMHIPDKWKVKKDDSGYYLVARPSGYHIGTPYADYKFRAEVPPHITLEEGEMIDTLALPLSTKISITLDFSSYLHDTKKK